MPAGWFHHVQNLGPTVRHQLPGDGRHTDDNLKAVTPPMTESRHRPHMTIAAESPLR